MSEGQLVEEIMKSAFAVADKPGGDRSEADLKKIREHAKGNAAAYDEALRRLIVQGQEAADKDYTGTRLMP